MATKRTRDRDRARRRQEEKDVSIWKEYKIIIQLLACIVIVIVFVFTQGLVVYEDKTVRDYVKAQLSETTNIKETVQYVKQFVDANRLWPGEEEETAPVSASIQSEGTTPSPESSTQEETSAPEETPTPETSAGESPASEPAPLTAMP